MNSHAQSDYTSFRCLVLDDENPNIAGVSSAFRSVVAQGRLELHFASTAPEAVQIFDDHYLDLILLDVFGPKLQAMGTDFYGYLAQRGSASQVIFLSHIDGANQPQELMSLIARSHRPPIVDFVDKRIVDDPFGSVLLPRMEAHEKMRFSVHPDGLDEVARLLLRRRKRYRSPGRPSLGRAAAAEMAVELERLCRSAFGGVFGSERTSPIEVRLENLDRRGLSSSVVIKAFVHVGLPALQGARQEFECVVKVGPTDEIVEEASRYDEYVKFGVPLEERVEMLACSLADSLGIIVYSLAGGTKGSLQSLDHALVDESSIGAVALGRLFDTNSWYSVDAGQHPHTEFFTTSYKASLGKAVKASHELMKVLASDLGLNDMGSAGVLEVLLKDGDRLTLPSDEFLGWGVTKLSRPWCLVHGDMHGGNVMLEIHSMSDFTDTPGSVYMHSELERVNLIDYRFSGPGPRCLDAVALDCAVRVADAETIARRYLLDGEQTPTGERLAPATDEVLSRLPDERRLLRAWSSLSAGDGLGWKSQTGAIALGLRRVFEVDPPPLDEYLAMIVIYGMRHLRYELPGLTRLRVALWVSSAFELLDEVR
jgi:CheY-like chemotaxis protein